MVQRVITERTARVVPPRAPVPTQERAGRLLAKEFIRRDPETGRESLDVVALVEQHGERRATHMLRDVGMRGASKVTKGAAEFLGRSVKLDTGEYIPKEAFEQLEPEQQELLRAVGIEQFNIEQERVREEFVAAHIELGTGEWVERETFEGLTPEQQEQLSVIGVSEFMGGQEELRREFEAAHIKLDTGEWIGRELYEGLTEELQQQLNTIGVEQFNIEQEGLRAEFEVVHMQLTGGEWIAKEQYAELTEEQQAKLQEVGVQGFMDWQDELRVEFEATHIKLEAHDEWINREAFEEMEPEQQERLREIGVVQFNVEQEQKREEFLATHVEVGEDEYITKESYENLPPKMQELVVAEGVSAISTEGMTPEQKLEKYKEWELVPEDTVFVGATEEEEPLYLEREAFESLPEKSREFIQQEGIRAFNEIVSPTFEWGHIGDEGYHASVAKAQEMFERQKELGILPESAIYQGLYVAGGSEAARINWTTPSQLGAWNVMYMQQVAGSVSAYAAAQQIAQQTGQTIEEVVAGTQQYVTGGPQSVEYLGALAMLSIAGTGMASMTPGAVAQFTQAQEVVQQTSAPSVNTVDMVEQLGAEQAALTLAILGVKNPEAVVADTQRWLEGLSEVDRALVSEAGVREYNRRIEAALAALAPYIETTDEGQTVRILDAATSLGEEQAVEYLERVGVEGAAGIIMAQVALRDFTDEETGGIQVVDAVSELGAEEVERHLAILMSEQEATTLVANASGVLATYTKVGTGEDAEYVPISFMEGLDIAGRARLDQVGYSSFLEEEYVLLPDNLSMTRADFDAMTPQMQEIALLEGAGALSLEGLSGEGQFQRMQEWGQIPRYSIYQGVDVEGAVQYTEPPFDPDDPKVIASIKAREGDYLKDSWPYRRDAILATGITLPHDIRSEKQWTQLRDVKPQYTSMGWGVAMGPYDVLEPDKFEPYWERLPEDERTVVLAHYYTPDQRMADLGHTLVSVIPVVGTIVEWDRMSTSEKIASAVLDAAIIGWILAPKVGLALLRPRSVKPLINAAKIAGVAQTRLRTLLTELKVAERIHLPAAHIQGFKSEIQVATNVARRSDIRLAGMLEGLSRIDAADLIKIQRVAKIPGLASAVTNVAKIQGKLGREWVKLEKLTIGTEKYIKRLTKIQGIRGKLDEALLKFDNTIKRAPALGVSRSRLDKVVASAVRRREALKAAWAKLEKLELGSLEHTKQFARIRGAAGKLDEALTNLRGTIKRVPTIGGAKARKIASRVIGKQEALSKEWAKLEGMRPYGRKYAAQLNRVKRTEDELEKLLAEVGRMSRTTEPIPAQEFWGYKTEWKGPGKPPAEGWDDAFKGVKGRPAMDDVQADYDRLLGDVTRREGLKALATDVALRERTTWTLPKGQHVLRLEPWYRAKPTTEAMLRIKGTPAVSPAPITAPFAMSVAREALAPHYPAHPMAEPYKVPVVAPGAPITTPSAVDVGISAPPVSAPPSVLEDDVIALAQYSGMAPAEIAQASPATIVGAYAAQAVEVAIGKPITEIATEAEVRTAVAINAAYQVAILQGVEQAVSTFNAVHAQTGSRVRAIAATEAIINTAIDTALETLTETETRTKTAVRVKARLAVRTILKQQMTRGGKELMMPLLPWPEGTAVEAERRAVPAGSIAWKHGLFWKVIPPPYDVKKPITLPKGVIPQGAKFIHETGKGSARRTVQVIGGVAPRDIDIDLGKIDVHIRTRKGETSIEFRSDGEKTDVGKSLPSTTRGVTVRGKPLAVGGVEAEKYAGMALTLEEELGREVKESPKRRRRAERRARPRHRDNGDWKMDRYYMGHLLPPRDLGVA